MGVFHSVKNFFRKYFFPTRPTLSDDILSACQWAVKTLSASGYKLDFSLESAKEIDRFFDEQNTPDGMLSKKGERCFLPPALMSVKQP